MSNHFDEHLSFEECVDIVYTECGNGEFLTKISRVNCHIYHCEECREMYSTILEAKETAEEFAREQIVCREESERVLRAIKNFVIKNQMAVEKIKKLVERVKDFVVYVNLNIPSLSEIGLIDNRNDYWHPVLATVAKSTGADSFGKEISSVLVNCNSNRISVEEDGVLSLVLSSQECDEDSIVLLVPHDGSKEIVMALPRQLEEDLFRVTFEDVTPGEYYIKIST